MMCINTNTNVIPKSMLVRPDLLLNVQRLLESNMIKGFVPLSTSNSMARTRQD